MVCLKCLQFLKGEGCYGLHEECFSDWFGVASTASFENLTQKSAVSKAPATEIPLQISSFFHGKFKKYAATLEGRSFILKMRQEEAPELPELEYLCNQISTVFSIPVAKFYIINFHGELVFVTENFIPHTMPMDLQHIYHFVKGAEYNCKELISIIQEHTQSRYFVDSFVKTILFDSLIGNHDRHGRNLGLIVTANGKTLAPIYDNVSYLGLESGKMLKADFNPAGKIATEATLEPSMQDYVNELYRLGYHSEVADFISNLTARGMQTIETLIDNSFCTDLMKVAIKRLINKRYRELKNAIGS